MLIPPDEPFFAARNGYAELDQIFRESVGIYGPPPSIAHRDINLSDVHEEGKAQSHGGPVLLNRMLSGIRIKIRLVLKAPAIGDSLQIRSRWIA